MQPPDKPVASRGFLGLAAALCLTATAGAADAPVSPGDIVPSAWQRHQITVNYFGITSLYSCDGLEEHVRSILVHLGARKDVKVDATGCARGPENPSHSAWIKADFYTLQPAESTTAADAIPAYWATRELTPRRPYFMDDGDCELVEELKDLITKNFSMRDVVYRTECVPHEITLEGFAVKGQLLVPAPAPGAPSSVSPKH